jgi:hypothetical protein
MPANHKWDFGKVGKVTSCGTVGCAAYIAHTIWPEDNLCWTRSGIDYMMNEPVMKEFFGLTQSELDRVFYGQGEGQPYPYREPNEFGDTYEEDAEAELVTPLMVAEALDAIKD